MSLKVNPHNTLSQLALVPFVMGMAVIIEVGEKSIVTSMVAVHLFLLPVELLPSGLEVK